MSLNLALSSAVSSIQAIQTRLGVAASNIANSDTDGYTVKTAAVATRVTGGTGSGVSVTGIQSQVDANLLKSIVAATSAGSKASVTVEFLDQLGNMLGSLSSEGSGDTLAATLSSLVSALEQLATTPESETLKTQAVLAIADAATSLRETSDNVQSLRQQADSGIETAIQSINRSLVSIDELNETISRAQAGGQSTSELDDQRMTAIRELSAYMDVTYFTDGTGAMKVYTSGGQPLVTSQVHLLSHDSASTVTSLSSYPSSGIDGIWLNGADITNTIRSGELSALVQLRDKTLPAVQDDLDTIASGLINTLNTLSNSGTASPAPQTLTGTVEGVIGTDALPGTGTLRVAVTDGDGLVVSALDIDLSAITTVGDLLTSLNGVAGLTASLDSSGKLVLSTTNSSTGVAVSGGDISGKDVSSHFGLNDLLTGTGAETIEIRADLLESPSRLATATLSKAITLAAGDVAVTVGSGAVAQAMADEISKVGLVTAAGTLVAEVGSLLEQAQSTAANKATTLSSLTNSFRSRYGVNIDEETARISELENAYSASAQVLSAVQEMFDSLLQAVR